MGRIGIAAVAASFLAVVATGAPWAAGQSPPSKGGDPPSPNVLLVLTDDQRPDSMEVMPATREFFSSGTEFQHAYTTTPQCCPARASIFTGQYLHNHGVASNEDAGKFDSDQSWARLLDEKGYRTGYFGKYLNDTNRLAPVPNFDRSFVGFDEDHRQHATRASSFIVGKTERYLKFLERSDSDPWAIQLSLRAPHVPLIYPPKYADFEVPPWDRNPATRERDFSDKHPDLGVGQKPTSFSRRVRTEQLRMLAAADDALRGLYKRLDRSGELADTLVIFMSDNGYYLGEHRLHGKVLPYLPSLEVPMYMRGPGLPDGVDSRMVANIDVAPTILDATNTPADYPIDGVSVFADHERDWLLVEGPNDAIDDELPLWKRGFLSESTHYFEWRDGRREYYDLGQDPWELENLLRDGNPANDPADEAAIAEAVDDASDCVGASECP